MAPIAERFVRVRADTSRWKSEVAKATTGTAMAKLGDKAGTDWAKGFLRSARAELAKAKLTVKVDYDQSGRPSSNTNAPTRPTRAPRVPKVPVELDPLVAAFQADVRKMTRDLAKQVSVKVPATADSAGLRAQLADLIRTVENQTKVKVPAGPDARTFEQDLRALVAEVSSQIKVNLPVGADGAEAGREAAREAERAAPKVKLGVDVDQGLAGAMRGIVAAATNAASSVTGLSGSFAPLVGAGAVVAGVAAAIAALPLVLGAATAAVYALGGALASLPAIGVGVGAVVGTLGLGFAGLADHFKKTAGGGGGAAKSLSAVRNATRAVAAAQRDLTKATKDIDKARKAEIERIDDLGRALRGAYIDVDEAILSVAEAQAELNEAMRTGSVDEIRKAELALKRANLTVEEAKDKAGDLADQKKKADKDGVEGSDQVQAALERQRDATERLTAAQEALADAQKSGGGGGGAARDLMKLAPAAQEVVKAIKALKPAWEDLRLSVQQKLFTGVGDEITRLAKTWLPQLKKTLGDYATTFNTLFLQLGDSLRKPEFVTNIAKAAEAVRRNLAKVGSTIAGPLVDAFGRLAGAAGPFLDKIGDLVADLVTDFSDWIKSADESGALTQFFKDAAYYLGLIWDIGREAVKVAGQLFDIWFGSGTAVEGDNALESLKKHLEKFSEWLKDEENQEKVRDFIDGFYALGVVLFKIGKWIVEEGIPALEGFLSWIDKWKTRIDEIKTKIDEWGDTFERWKERVWGAVTSVSSAFGLITGSADKTTSGSKNSLGSLPGFISSLGGRISGAASGMWDGIRNSFRSAMNWIIDRWNNLSFTVPQISFPAWLGGGTFGGFPVGTRDVQRLAKGGVARATPGGIPAVIAEGGKDEAVAPVDVLQRYIAEAVAAAMVGTAALGGAAPVVHIYLDGRELKNTVVEVIADNPDKVSSAARKGDRRRNNIS